MKLKRRQHETRLELTPLIDVVFLLLVFFVFALVLMVRADALDLQLPRVGSGSPADRSETVRVTLAEDGAIFVQGEPVERSGAGGAVLRAQAAAPGAAVVLSADARATSGALIELADALVAAGITEFSVLGTPAVQASPAAPASIENSPNQASPADE